MDIPLNSFKAEVIQILIVEDEFILAANLKESLEYLGYDVVDIVDSAETAIEKVAELHPDLVLMDIKLRGEMDGIDAAEKIWNSLQIPFIYITGHSDKSTVEKATKIFTFGYIIKPVTTKNLYAAIQTALSIFKYKQTDLLLQKAHEELQANVREFITKIALSNDELKVKNTTHQVKPEQAVKEESVYSTDKPTSLLTSRQIEVLRLIAEGFSTKDIAELLNISSKTVEAHRVQLMKRLKIYDVVGLVRYAVWKGMVAFDTKKRINDKGEYRTKENP
ncbi:response regulator [Nostoc sp. UIC 10890]